MGISPCAGGCLDDGETGAILARRSGPAWTAPPFSGQYDSTHDPIVRLTGDQEDALGVRFALFNELLRASDIVTLHVPLNDVTSKIMSTAQFAMMKRTAILINTCRGPVVDEDALHQALTSGTIAGAST
jgi:phosphoglycerate dehydrogenase-like enzyme